MSGGELLDDGGDSGDEKVGGGILTHFAVYAGRNLQNGREGDLIGDDDTGANGGKAIQALAEVPLLMVPLNVAGADVAYVS